jgi:hypothetical protein
MRWTIRSRGKPTAPAPAPAIPLVFRLPSAGTASGTALCFYPFFSSLPPGSEEEYLSFGVWPLLWRAYNSKTFRGVVKDHKDIPWECHTPTSSSWHKWLLRC